MHRPRQATRQDRRKIGPPPARGRRYSAKRNIFGFTLVEVLVALTIVAIALAAAARAGQMATTAAEESRLRTLATWVAQNRLAERDIARVFPAAGVAQGTARMGGIDFAWTETVSETPNPAFRKVVVEVSRPENSQTLVALNGYLIRAAAPQ